MNAIESKIAELETLSNTIYGLIKKIVEDNRDAIIFYNTYYQLYLVGETSDGIFIDSYEPYKSLTIQLKSKKRQPVDRVTLKDTGAFHKSFIIVTEEDSFIITATDVKTEALVFKYGDEIFGLTEDSKEQISRGIVKPNLLTLLRERL